MHSYHEQRPLPTDFGPYPFVIDINKATLCNINFRTVLWTGSHLQLTVMTINPGEDIGLEAHPDVDQFLRIEQGCGLCQMGRTKCDLHFAQPVFEDSAIFVPAGIWHNITNTGHTPLKLYSIYAPPNHPFGTLHPTKAIAEAEEGH
jgi:mannose-6-phosphate isomerase-like protein (cupin superfamily)